MKTNKGKYNYYFLGPGSDYGEAMWSDLKNRSDIHYSNYVIGKSSRFLKLLHHFHFSFQLNGMFELPFQKFWDSKFKKNLNNFDEFQSNCIIFTDISAARVSLSFLEYLSKLKNSKLVLINVNKYNKKEKILNKRLKYFSKIYTFDLLDSQQYNFKYYPYCYSKQNLNFQKSSNLNQVDAFFVGNSKGRANTLNLIYKNILSKGGSAKFYINNVEKNEKVENGIEYNHPISYDKVLKNIAQCNCLVEILEEGQSGTTLRMMEAIVYNKKLLTNNQNITLSKFYQPEFIQVFTTPDRINYDFFSDQKIVNYKYNNEFSPNYFIQELERIL